MVKFLVLVCAAALSASCSAAIIPADMEEVATKYFAAIGSDDVDGALALYDAEFYAITPRSEWASNLKGVSDKLGKLQSHKLVAWRVRAGIGSKSGTVVELKYTVSYANYPAEEIIIIRRGTRNVPKIIRHKINSSGLQGEMTVHRVVREPADQPART